MVSDLAGDAQGLTFTHLADSLPWVLPAEAAEGVELTKIGHRNSPERLIVRDLQPGKYELTIEGQKVGTYSNDRLAAGIELQANDKTPQYQQALAVANLNKRRNDEAYHPIRDQFGALKGERRKLSDAENANDPQLADKRAAFEQWHAEMTKRVEDLKGKAKELEDQIYAANQPKPLRYELEARAVSGFFFRSNASKESPADDRSISARSRADGKPSRRRGTTAAQSHAPASVAPASVTSRCTASIIVRAEPAKCARPGGRTMRSGPTSRVRSPSV